MLFWIRSLSKLRTRLWLPLATSQNPAYISLKCRCYSFLIRKYTKVCCGPRDVRLCHSCTWAGQQDWMLNLRLWGKKVTRYPHLYNLSLKLYKGNEIEIIQEWNLAVWHILKAAWRAVWEHLGARKAYRSLKPKLYVCQRNPQQMTAANFIRS